MTSSTASNTPFFKSQRLEGKVALITGGASGIGECTAKHFLKHGARIIIADIQDDLGEKIIRDDSEAGGKTVFYVHCDVTKESDVENAVNFTVSKFGKLDIMFSNAGTTGKNAGASILGVESEEFKRVFDVNVFGAFLCAKHAARVMIPAKKGSIVFSSSVSSVVSEDVCHEYVASKHAVVGLTKNLCVEMGQHGIRVNCVSPFGVATPMLTKCVSMGKDEVEKLVSAAGNLKEAILEADDVAEAVVYLGSDESKYISGLNLVIDGGYSTTNVSFKSHWQQSLSRD